MGESEELVRSKARVRSGKSRSLGVMFLETQLDSAMTSERSEIRFIREYLSNFGAIELIAKEVHSRADLQKFLEYSRRDEKIQALHIVSHGLETRKESCIVLTDDEVLDLKSRENRSLFRDLQVEVIFLSCCQLGRDVGA